MTIRRHLPGTHKKGPGPTALFWTMSQCVSVVPLLTKSAVTVLYPPVAALLVVTIEFQ